MCAGTIDVDDRLFQQALRCTLGEDSGAKECAVQLLQVYALSWKSRSERKLREGTSSKGVLIFLQCFVFCEHVREVSKLLRSNSLKSTVFDLPTSGK
ncbi:hypothetical protein R1flu_021259 [Riccia fluitans]|uniref:Uncharacterized protein n=1 Tax=Riccia fluitans TaxID=41844 RepID=A0ABD1ZNV3_9MARC